jgi:hypothetical protein
MASPEQRRHEQATYLTLIGLFLGLFAAFAARVRGRDEPLELRSLDLALLGLATERAGRLAAYDRVTAPLRAPFTETEPDSSGAGATVEARGTGAQKAIGELLSCPTCVGTWVAALLVYGLQVAPGPTRLFMAILAATGLAELLDSANEALSWTGRAARTQASQ